MKVLGSLALALLSAVVFAGSLSAGVEPGDQGPNFKFEKSWNIEEGITELDQYRGKIVMIEAWATW